MNKNHLIFLEHILANIELIEKSTTNISKKDFENQKNNVPPHLETSRFGES